MHVNIKLTSLNYTLKNIQNIFFTKSLNAFHYFISRAKTRGFIETMTQGWGTKGRK